MNGDGGVRVVIAEDAAMMREGLRAAIDIRREHPDVGVLVFSRYVETRYATRLLAKLALPSSDGDNRRVLAVLRHVGA